MYDITYGSLVPGTDNLVIIDDSIVRGTTLKQSIIGILDRLGPKKIVIVSSSPQVRYPDYYGIDMAKMSEFIAFKAAIELLKEREMRDVIESAYRKSKEQVSLTQRTDGELRKGDIRSLYRRRDFRKNGGTAHSERYESPSADCISAS